MEEGADLVKQLAADHAKLDSRLRLRNELRRYVERIELFRTVPASLTKGLKLPSPKPGVKLEDLLHSRCVRIVFTNGAERWVVDHGDTPGYGIRFDGAVLPPAAHLIANRDDFGGRVLLDQRQESSVRADPIKKRERSKGAAARRPSRRPSRPGGNRGQERQP